MPLCSFASTLYHKRRESRRVGLGGWAVIAEEAGRVVLENGRLSIREVLDIGGSVDFESGNVDATSDVNIRGTVRDLFEVISKKSIIIGGANRGSSRQGVSSAFLPLAVSERASLSRLCW